METLEGNKLIAEFMGIKSSLFHSLTGKNYMVFDFEDGRSIRHTDADWKLEYHISWDWLMPVVYKINGLRIENGILVNDSVMTYVNQLGKVKRSLMKLNIEPLWKEVVEFIKWYNQLTTK